MNDDRILTQIWEFKGKPKWHKDHRLEGTEDEDELRNDIHVGRDREHGLNPKQTWSTRAVTEKTKYSSNQQ